MYPVLLEQRQLPIVPTQLLRVALSLPEVPYVVDRFHGHINYRTHQKAACACSVTPEHLKAELTEMPRRRVRGGGRSLQHTFFFFKLFYFLEQLQVHRKTEYKVEISHLPLAPLPPPSPVHYHHPHQSGLLVTGDEPTLTPRCHSEPMVYLRVRSWCVVQGTGQIRKDMYPSLCFIHNTFTALKILLHILF